MRQFVNSSSDVSLLHSTLFQLLHRDGELTSEGNRRSNNQEVTRNIFTCTLALLKDLETIWGRKPWLKTMKFISWFQPQLTSLPSSCRRLLVSITWLWQSEKHMNNRQVRRTWIFITQYSPSPHTFSFCASPRTLSSSVIESTNPWKWWLHIFSISRSWFLIRASSFSMNRPCSWPSYTDLEKNKENKWVNSPCTHLNFFISYQKLFFILEYKWKHRWGGFVHFNVWFWLITKYTLFSNIFEDALLIINK